MKPSQIIDELQMRDLYGEARKVARAHDVTVEEMVGRSRLSAQSAARHEFWALLYARGHWSYPRIGLLFGRDHTTVMAGVAAHLKRSVVKVEAAHEREKCA